MIYLGKNKEGREVYKLEPKDVGTWWGHQAPIGSIIIYDEAQLEAQKKNAGDLS